MQSELQNRNVPSWMVAVGIEILTPCGGLSRPMPESCLVLCAKLYNRCPAKWQLLRIELANPSPGTTEPSVSLTERASPTRSLAISHSSGSTLWNVTGSMEVGLPRILHTRLGIMISICVHAQETNKNLSSMNNAEKTRSLLSLNVDGVLEDTASCMPRCNPTAYACRQAKPRLIYAELYLPRHKW